MYGNPSNLTTLQFSAFFFFFFCHATAELQCHQLAWHIYYTILFDASLLTHIFSNVYKNKPWLFLCVQSLRLTAGGDRWPGDGSFVFFQIWILCFIEKKGRWKVSVWTRGRSWSFRRGNGITNLSLCWLKTAILKFAVESVMVTKSSKYYIKFEETFWERFLNNPVRTKQMEHYISVYGTNLWNNLSKKPKRVDLVLK